MTGIYKITSPSGKIYIGQSINIERRFSQYKYLKCKKQEFFDCTGEKGLNCRLTKSSDKSGKISYSTRLKMGRKDIQMHLKKTILDSQNGIFYFGAKEAGCVVSLREERLRLMLNGKIKNTTDLIYV